MSRQALGWSLVIAAVLALGVWTWSNHNRPRCANLPKTADIFFQSEADADAYREACGNYWD